MKPVRGGELRLIQSKKDIESPDTSSFVPTPVPQETIREARAALQKRQKTES